MVAYVEFEILEGAYEISCPDALCPAQGALSLDEIANLSSNSLLDKHNRYRLNRGKLKNNFQFIFPIIIITNNHSIMKQTLNWTKNEHGAHGRVVKRFAQYRRLCIRLTHQHHPQKLLRFYQPHRRALPYTMEMLQHKRHRFNILVPFCVQLVWKNFVPVVRKL